MLLSPINRLASNFHLTRLWFSPTTGSFEWEAVRSDIFENARTQFCPLCENTIFLTVLQKTQNLSIYCEKLLLYPVLN